MKNHVFYLMKGHILYLKKNQYISEELFLDALQPWRSQ